MFCKSLGQMGTGKRKKNATSCGDRNEEAQSVGQLQPQHSLGSVLAGQRVSQLHPGTAQLGSLTQGWISGTRAFCLGPGTSGTRGGFVLPIQDRAHCSTDEPTPLPLALPSAMETRERRHGTKGWGDGEGSPSTSLWAHILMSSKWPRDRPRQLSAQPSLGKSALNGKTWPCLR